LLRIGESQDLFGALLLVYFDLASATAFFTSPTASLRLLPATFVVT
jgi:hypothetical protein